MERERKRERQNFKAANLNPKQIREKNKKREKEKKRESNRKKEKRREREKEQERERVLHT